MYSQRKVFIHSRKRNILLTLLLFAKPPPTLELALMIVMQKEQFYSLPSTSPSNLAPTPIFQIMLAET